MQVSGTSTTSFTSSEIHSAIDLLLSSFCHSLGKKAEDAELLATSLLHDTVFPGQKRKATAGKEAPVLEGLDLAVVESLFLSQPLLEATLQRLLLHLFTLPPRAQLAPILPSIDQPSSTSLSTLQQIFLASALPHHLRALWRPLFNTNLHGESFSKFAGNIINQGPTLIVIWDEVGFVLLETFSQSLFSGWECVWWFCNRQLEAGTKVLWKTRELPVPAGPHYGGL